MTETKPIPVYVLGFARKWKEAIRTVRKRSTIRLPRRDGRLPKLCGALRLYSGMRTASVEWLGDYQCTGVSPIKITGGGWIYIGSTHGRWLHPGEVAALARRDGFTNVAELLEHFRKHYGLPFRGHLIEWEPYHPTFNNGKPAPPMRHQNQLRTVRAKGNV